MYNFFLWGGIIFFTTIGYSQSLDEVKLIDSLSVSLKKHVVASDFENAALVINEIDSLLAVTKNDTVRTSSYWLKGNYSYRTSDYENAMKYWLIAADGFEKVHDSLGASMAYNNISLILGASKEYNRSLTLKKKALGFCPESDTSSWKTRLLHNIGSAYQLVNKIDSSFYYHQQAYKISKQRNDSTSLGSYHFFYALNYLQLKEYQKMLLHSDTVQNYFASYISRPQYENSLFYTAKALNEVGRYQEALVKVKESTNLIRESGMSINIAENLKLLSTIYKNLGRKGLAYDKLKEAVLFKDSIFNIEKNKAVLEMELKYQTEKKEKENLKLKQEAAQKDLYIANKNNLILITSLIFGGVILLLSLYYLKRYRQKNIDLKNSIIKREKAERELEVVRDNIAKDFHDDLGNKLARITTLSDFMIKTSVKKDKKEIVNALQRIKEDSDILYTGTRDFMFSLKSKSDYVEELFTYLSDFGEDFFKSFKIDFFVDKTITQNVRLPYYWNRQIIMIFKEAMTNTVRHSHASSVRLILSLKQEEMLVSLNDNGSGFMQEDVKRRSGLDNMLSRAEKIGGKIRINSSEEGTQVSFNISLPNNAKNKNL